MLSPYLSEFEVDGITYHFEAADGGPVSFYSEDIVSDDLFGEFVVPILDRPTGHNIVPILKEVKKVLLEWIGRYKPYSFHYFSVSERKNHVYSWFSKRLAKELPNYMLYEHEGVFMFIRQDID